MREKERATERPFPSTFHFVSLHVSTDFYNANYFSPSRKRNFIQLYLGLKRKRVKINRYKVGTSSFFSFLFLF